ncbi:DUF1697 domain-containing protein [Larkinella knui]|uniref:DUF1697 domain-containing protein n=1 Tax=Larkinella knui TaxID=2025310 RepID=A0A3P1CEW0_9BACT|nr:DUF1697 domain-containing protein [Larkinella knui]RRB11750.1 DUF1697 domain-containing protein [Larkinella knui]
MQTYIAILRGINVSGQKRIAMNELKSLFEELNCRDVKTYIQSGNVIFNHTSVDDQQQAREIERKLVQKYTFQVPVLVRSQSEWAHIAAHNPFLKETGIEIDKLHVTFLSEVPSAVNSDKIKDLQFGKDRFILAGKEIYVNCPSGYGTTKLSNSFFENKLKVTATTRNWKTVNELLKIAESVSDEAGK